MWAYRLIFTTMTPIMMQTYLHHNNSWSGKNVYFSRVLGIYKRNLFKFSASHMQTYVINDILLLLKTKIINDILLLLKTNVINDILLLLKTYIINGILLVLKRI